MERGTFRAGQSTLSILRFLESIYYVIWNLDSCIISQRSVFQIVKMIELVLLVLKQSILILRRSRKITIMERTLHSMTGIALQAIIQLLQFKWLDLWNRVPSPRHVVAKACEIEEYHSPLLSFMRSVGNIQALESGEGSLKTASGAKRNPYP